MNRAEAFLEAYKACGSVTQAAAAIGIERQLHYRQLKADAKYQKAFTEAHQEWLLNLADEAKQLAKNLRGIAIAEKQARVEALQERHASIRAAIQCITAERGADMADIPGGSSGFYARDYKGKDADQAVYRIDTGLIALFAELRAIERQAAGELGQWIEKQESTGANGGPIAVKVEFVTPAPVNEPSPVSS